MANEGTFRVQLLKSGIGFDKTQKRTLLGLGLRKRHAIVTLKDTKAARGQVEKVRHLVRVVEGDPAPKAAWKGAIVTAAAGGAASARASGAKTKKPAAKTSKKGT